MVEHEEDEMTEQRFRELIRRPESETLDYKAEIYNLSNSRNKFIKDVIALANTPRDDSAYIVLGVRWTPESGSEVVGIQAQVDDTQLQDAFGACPVQPIPRLTYAPLRYNGKRVGIVEIPLQMDGPYTPVKNFIARSRDTGTPSRDEALQAGVVYYGRGTQNAPAVGTELKRIFRWFQASDVGTPDSVEDSWKRFIESVHGFDQGMTYLLAVDRISSEISGPVSELGLVSWRAVVDFDPDSEASGLMNSIGDTLGRNRVIHRAVRGQYQVQRDPGTHWFFARGLAGREATIARGDHRDWLRDYKRELGRQLERIAGAVSPSAIMAVVLWSDSTLERHLRTFIEELYGAFGDSVEVVVVGHEAIRAVSASLEDLDATIIPMSFRSLFFGLAVHYADLLGETDEVCVLPSMSGAPIRLEQSDWLWISEDIELLHRSLGTIGDDTAIDYRRGADISWRNLQLRHDCDRDITLSLRSRVEDDLKKRQTARVNLYHEPGSGGTTVGRRVAWDLHSRYPVGILRACAPRGAAERIAKIAAVTESSVLVIVDGGQHSERETDDLYEFLKADHTPAVLLQVLRRFHTPQVVGRRQFRLDTPLTDTEADRFRVAYTEAMPGKRNQLSELRNRRNHPQRSAFFFGLTAFEQNFRGLRHFVGSRIAGVTAIQQRLLVYVAIAHYYGQQSVPAQAFASMAGLPPSRKLQMKAIFVGGTVQALDLLIENKAGEWRTSHQFIAFEIMRQLIIHGSEQRQESWKQALSKWGKEFVDFCDGDVHPTSDRLLELIRRVFIYRDNSEVLGTERAALSQFAQFIEEIPSDHGKLVSGH